MNLRWALNRLRAMGAREVAYRGVQSLHGRLQRAGLDLARPRSASPARGKPWLGAWPRSVAAEPYLAAADRIVAGHFRLFADREWELGTPPDWNRDPQSGVHAPLAFGKTINYRDTSIVGNIKYLWEPNRHLELVTLAQAWRLSGEPRYADACRLLVDSWIKQCPYMRGVNWTSSLELALRLTNWAFAWHLLGGDASPLFQHDDGAAFKERWLTAVRQHCHFIAGHLSRYSSANNHLLGELLGLLVGSLTWSCWPESLRWSSRARSLFEEQALLQNASDGVNLEQAIWYQHEVADMMLLAGLTAQANGQPFGQPFWDRLEAMLEFIASCMDVRGHVPALGDSDDAVMVRFDPTPQFRAYHSLLASGAVLFNRGDFRFKAQVFDDKSRWLLGDAAAARFASIAPDASGKRMRHDFQAGGYYILGSDFETSREVRIIADAAPLGYLAIAAHGHADALALVLSAGGHPLLVDPGTYSYHTQRTWRDYFRGTSAHNTLRVDGADQSVSGGAFLWNRHASARCLAFDLGPHSQRLLAEHDGYRRLPDPVLHRREWVYESAARRLIVTDEIHCSTTHEIEMFWHFAPACVVELDAGAVTAARDGVALTLSWPASFSAHLVRGIEEPPQGWVSERFDTKVPADTLVVAGTASSDWRGLTTLQISF
jgi:Heparinase II/III-like protein/Heparinase II/III N-terminus